MKNRGAGGGSGKMPAQDVACLDLSQAVTRRRHPVATAQRSHFFESRAELPKSAPRPVLADAAARWLGCDSDRLRLVAPGTNPAARMPGAALLRNPDPLTGRSLAPARVAALAAQHPVLVVDERQADPRPDLSVVKMGLGNVIVWRDCRHFWGVEGPDIAVGPRDRLAPLPEAPDHPDAALAMADAGWADDLCLYLTEATLRLDHLAARAGWRFAGGTSLCRHYAPPDADAAQAGLAAHAIAAQRIGARLRLAIPADHAEWDRLTEALRPNAKRRP